MSMLKRYYISPHKDLHYLRLFNLITVSTDLTIITESAYNDFWINLYAKGDRTTSDIWYKSFNVELEIGNYLESKGFIRFQYIKFEIEKGYSFIDKFIYFKSFNIIREIKKSKDVYTFVKNTDKQIFDGEKPAFKKIH